MNKSIYILEHFDFSTEQKARLNSLGNLKYFEKANKSEINEAIQKADVILMDWIDPTDIITQMEKGSFVCLPYTGYEWIKTLKESISNGVIISNTPNYSTNAVAEHHLSLMLAASKNLGYFNQFVKENKGVPFNRNIELKDKTVGIVGLGHIGKRLAELLKPFGVNILTYNKTQKNMSGIKDVTLNKLLKQSDFICVTCQLNKETANMISNKQFAIMKPNAILTQTTGGVIDLFALYKALQRGKLFAIGLDDVDQQYEKKQIPQGLMQHEKVICTYHRAYDTTESEKNRINLCIDNIEAYIKGNPINLVKI